MRKISTDSMISADFIIEELTTLLFNRDAQGKVHEALESLDLSNLMMGCAGLSADGFKTVFDFIQEHFPKCRHLNLSSNSLKETGIQVLFKALPQLTQLKSLDLSFNNLEEAGMQALAPVLSKMTRLEHLNLNSNFFRVTGMKILS